MENIVRLNKFIASNGISSRRKVDEFIEQGRVTVNGNTIKELGFKIDPSIDKISLDGELIRTDTKKIYIMLNKPKGVITSVSDEKHRETVIDLIKINQKIFPVGRLDYNTSGLLLLTNDGELANKLMSPKSKVYKTYFVQLSRPLEEKHRVKLSEGIKLEGVMTAPAIIKFPKKTDYQSLYISIYEGKNRQVRNMFEHYGYFVRELERTEYAGLKLGSLRQGEWSYLTAVELASLNALVKDTKSSYPKTEHTGKRPFRKITKKYRAAGESKERKSYGKRDAAGEKVLSYNKKRFEERGVELGFRRNQDPELKKAPEMDNEERTDSGKFGGKYGKRDSKPGFKKLDGKYDKRDSKPGYKKFDKREDRKDSKPGFKKFDGKYDKKDSKPGYKKFDKRDDRKDSKPGFKKFDDKYDKKDSKSGYKKFDKRNDRKDSKPGFKKFDDKYDKRDSKPGFKKSDDKYDKRDSKPGFKKFGKSNDNKFGKPEFKKSGSGSDKSASFKKFGNKNAKRTFRKPAR